MPPVPRCPNTHCREPLQLSIDELGRVAASCAACARWRSGQCVDCHRPRENRLARRCDQCRRQRCLRELPLRYRKRRGRKHVDALTAEQHRRRLAGLCIDCGSPDRRGKTWRCEACKEKEALRAHRRFYRRHRSQVLARSREYNARPEVNARHCAQKREWRRNNRRKVLMQKRRARLAGKPGGWATREKYLAYHKAYREAHREQYRENARRRYYEHHPVRPDPYCRDCGAPIPWRGSGRPPTRCEIHRPARRTAKGAAA